jgi:hypothetical protein
MTVPLLEHGAERLRIKNPEIAMISFMGSEWIGHFRFAQEFE